MTEIRLSLCFFPHAAIILPPPVSGEDRSCPSNNHILTDALEMPGPLIEQADVSLTAKALRCGRQYRGQCSVFIHEATDTLVWLDYGFHPTCALHLLRLLTRINMKVTLRSHLPESTLIAS